MRTRLQRGTLLISRLAMVGFLLLGPLLLAASMADDGTFVISPVGVVGPDGSICQQMAVVIEPDGTIAAVIPADQADPKLSTFAAASGAVLTPGLHDLLGSLGARGSLTAGTVLIDNELAAADAFDPTDPELDRAAKHGVLYSTIAALPAGVLNGTTATFICRSSIEATSVAAGKPCFALSGTVLNSSREPTSRSAMVSIWKDWLKSGDSALQSPGILFCPDAIDLRQTLSLGWKSLPVLVHSGDARSPVGRLAGRDAMMVVGPFLEGGDPAVVSTAIRAARTGTELAFKGAFGGGPADQLRGSAAIAVSAGLDGDAARRALFSNPARVAGCSGVGVIEPGARADLVLFSTDPLDPGAKVLQVWIGGVQMRSEPTGHIRPLKGIR
ncbi:MAG: hypothetical protein VX949_08005 [Planctomycetota bacterium]|nr:hypothetical protein [Planctomycetota bacterium]